MSEPRWLDAEEREAWVGVLALLVLLPPRLDAQLERDSGLNLFEYLALHSLSAAPGRSLRMRELAELTDGSLSRLSNVVKRLEQRGWVRRDRDPDDGRSTIASLTDLGWAGLQEAAPGHVESVRSYVLEPLTTAQVRTLSAIGTRIRQRIEADLPPRRLRPSGNAADPAALRH